ncbi:hypothetical protein [Paenibacillus sp. O199]|uniref:hypothetical protein n=1 Tax=Paenibacillus sp. O199 TaxID=1643925 RepID=UPI0007BEB456|nr:hypothetical protein [Paenibacillus sp. O199]PIH59114.1 hypothetical protein CS562_14335 [Paenibacillus sp. LK1]
MKLVKYDSNSKLETWKFLGIGTNKPHELNNFMFNGYRIYDNENNTIIKTNLNLKQWIKDNEKPQVL